MPDPTTDPYAAPRESAGLALAVLVLVGAAVHHLCGIASVVLVRLAAELERLAAMGGMGS